MPPLMNPKQGKALRYERKFFIEELTLPQVMLVVKQHPAMFRELYPPRFINNFYFDTAGMNYFFANVDGDPLRAKIRVRWYHDLFQSVETALLEVKYKDGLVGDKWQYPFPSFEVAKGFNQTDLLKIIRQSGLPEDLRAGLLGMEITLLNRYYRYYFATPDKKFRLTIDTQLAFYHVDRFNNQFRKSFLDTKNSIVELKYDPEYDPAAQRIAAKLPFRVTRSSKYVSGIEQVYL